MWLWDGNAGYRRSDNDHALDTFGNDARISTVAVEFCAGVRIDRDVLCYCGRECETSVLQSRQILRHLYPTGGKYDVDEIDRTLLSFSCNLHGTGYHLRQISVAVRY